MNSSDILFRQAVAAAKDGDLDTALDLVKEVLDEDEENVKAWLLLARLTKDKDERRVALANVLLLDPENERAKQMQARMEEQVEKEETSKEEIIPGVSRRLALMIGAGALVVLLLIVVVVMMINSNQAAQRDEQTQVAQQATRDDLNRQATQTQAAINQDVTATQRMIVQMTLETLTPSLTPTSAVATLPPTLTPTPPATNTPTPIPPPADIPGRLVGWSGRGEIVDDLDLISIPLDGLTEPEPIFGEEGRMPQLFPDAERLLFVEYNRGAFSDEIRFLDAEGEFFTTNLGPAVAIEPFDSPSMAALSRDGRFIVFIGELLGAQNTAVFLFDLDAPVETSISRLTNDSATYSFPAISPDNSAIAVVRNDTESENPGVDLVLIDIASQTPRSITTDRNATQETMPGWAPNATGGLLLFYAATTDGVQHDIYMMDPSAPDSGFLRIESPADDILPVPGPTGGYLAFASNRDGDYDVFLYDLNTSETFQVTRTDVNTYPGDWR